MRHIPRILILLPAMALMSCAEKSDTSALPYLEQHIEEVPQWIADLDAELANSGRAQRWRENQRRWSARKQEYVAGQAAKRSKDIAESVANNPDFIRRLLSLRRRGAIGAEGAVPPMLGVTAVGDSTVELRNVSREPLRVNVLRAFGGRYGMLVTHCELRVLDANYRQVFETQIAPGESLRFHNPEWAPCNRGKESTPLEFEIWRDQQLVWVSGSRLPALLRVPADAVEEVLARGARER